MTKAQRDIKRKLRVLNYAKDIGNVSKACRYFGISRETFYLWKRAYERFGEKALINSKPCLENPKLRTPPEIAFHPVRIPLSPCRMPCFPVAFGYPNLL